MDASEPHVRRRGLFTDLDSGDPDTGDYESAEGVAVRIGIPRQRIHRSFAIASTRTPSAAGHIAFSEPAADEGRAAAAPPLRSASETDTRQRARMHR